MGFFTKILDWVRVNGATVFAVVQSVLKAVKEILTGVVNLLSIFLPTDKAQAVVGKVRDFVNFLDEKIEQIKTSILGKII